MLRNAIAAMAMAAALSSCATGYHSATNPLLGLTGGYWDQPGPGKLIKVGFSGNGYIAADTVSTYLMYRCAEVAVREGATHFLMYANLPDAIADRRSSERNAASLAGKPATYAYILVVPEGEPGALSAKEVIARLAPLVQPTQAPEKAS